MVLLPTDRSSPRAGYSALELAFSVTIFVVVLLSSLAMVNRDTHLARSALGIGTVENMAQEMLFELEKELVNASANDRISDLTAPLAAGATTMSLGSTRGFPPDSELVVDFANGAREIIRYNAFGNASFSGMERGLHCTEDIDHPEGARVRWGGWAHIPPSQPPPGDVTGQAMEPGGAVFFQGEGTGFAYRVPIDSDDPLNGTNYLDDLGESIEWGAVLQGQPPGDCDIALYFQPQTFLAEATTGDDINGDGDTDDVFDVGQIRRVIWNHEDDDIPVLDIGLGPSAVLQERCNYGGDLDNDGFADPIFLWNAETRQLHMRVMVLGNSVADMPVVRTVESIIYLRNEQEDLS